MDFYVCSSESSDEVCYPPWGCYNKLPPWDDIVFYQLPQSPSVINTTFKLYNAAKPNGVLLDNTNPITSDIKEGDDIVVLIHGLSSMYLL